MSKLLQWVIGVGVVVMVIAVVFASVAPIVLPRLGLAVAPAATTRVMPRMPLMPGFMFGLGRPGFRPPFFGLFGLLSCLWPLLLIGLFVWAIVSLTHQRAPLPTVPPMAAQSPLPPASLPVCSECGQPLQPGWRHCPSCGKAIDS